MTRLERAAAGASAALLAAAGGCLNFAEPAPGPGQLESTLVLTEEPSPRGHFSARLSPGTGPDGDVRPVTDPTIRVLDTPVRPSAGSGAVRLTYSRSFELDGAGLERTNVELAGPRLGERRPGAVVTLPLVRRAGPDSVRLAEGEALELPLLDAPDPATDGDVERVRWALSVIDPEASRELYVERGAGAVPDTLEVAGDRLSGWAGTAPLEALLDVEVSAERPPGATGYETSFDLEVQLEWVIVRP